MILQKTLKHAVKISGIGLHSGLNVNLNLMPAPVDAGIIFQRVDLSPMVTLKVDPFKVEESLLCSTLVVGSAKVATIEHLMAAFSAMEIDNIIVEIDAPEVPVMDGSSAEFMFALKSAGLSEQTKARNITYITKPVRVEDGDKFAEFLPVDADKGLNFKISIDFPHPVIAGTKQEVDFDLSALAFEKTVARARTFGMVKDVEYLHSKGLAKGASLDNAVGITDSGVINKDGLRYADEFVRHKLLDAIGDTYVGGAIVGKFHAHKPGHALNNKLLRKLFSK